MLSIPRWIQQHDQTHHDDDGFDRVPDALLLLIFNYIYDVKTFSSCRAVSKRFNTLIPQADTDKLLLEVARDISAAETEYDDSFFVNFLRSNFNYPISPKPLPDATSSQKSLAQILRGFQRIRELEIELPSRDLSLEKGAVIRWRAEFGSTLRSCVILGFRSTAGGVGGGGEGKVDLGGEGLKTRMVWTISALIAASARHNMLKEVVREHGELEGLVARDREEQGTVVMDKDGLREYRESFKEDDKEAQLSGNAVTLRMRMRHEPLLELAGGIWMKDATLVVVGPTAIAADKESGLATGAFGGVYGEAVQKLLKSRSYLLEMNSSCWWWGL